MRPAALAASLLFSQAASALPSVSYVAVDLANVVAGQDLWRYDYVITGPLGSFQDVNLIFPYALYADLAVLPTYNAAVLSPLETQPDPFLVADGQVTVTALATLTGASHLPLSVSFVWLGAGRPGAQAFEHLDAFSVLGTGATVLAGTPAAVPEPASTWLTLAGLALLAPFSLGRAKRLNAGAP